MESLLGALGWFAVPALAGAIVGITLRSIKDEVNRLYRPRRFRS